MTFYIQYDKDDEAMRPLIYCVANAFPARDREDFWYYVPTIFDENRGGRREAIQIGILSAT